MLHDHPKPGGARSRSSARRGALPRPPRPTGPDLFAWFAARTVAIRRGTPPRIVLLPDAADPDGFPRAGLMHAGARVPVLYPTIAAAVAALSRMEARP